MTEDKNDKYGNAIMELDLKPKEMEYLFLAFMIKKNFRTTSVQCFHDHMDSEESIQKSIEATIFSEIINELLQEEIVKIKEENPDVV